MGKGEEHIRLAEKYLKTSLLKWTPDYDSAADEFSRAAAAFKIAKRFEAALDASERGCEAYKQIGSLYQAAKMLDQAVMICRDSGSLKEIQQYAERGALLYRQNGSPESAASLLEKAGKMLEKLESQAAAECYAKAAETIIIEDRPKVAAEYMTKVVRIHIREKRMNSAKESIKKARDLYFEANFTASLSPLITAGILIELYLGDVVAAEKEYTQWAKYLEPEFENSIHRLLKAIDEEDVEEMKASLNSSVMKNMDVEFAILARDLPLSEFETLGSIQTKMRDTKGNEEKKITSKLEDVVLTESKEFIEEAEKDDEEGDLC